MIDVQVRMRSAYGPSWLTHGSCGRITSAAWGDWQRYAMIGFRVIRRMPK